MSSRWLLPPLWRVVLDYAPDYARPAYAEALPEFAAVHVPITGKGVFRGVYVDTPNRSAGDNDAAILDWVCRRHCLDNDDLEELLGLWGLETIQYVASRGVPLTTNMFSAALARGDLRALRWLVRYDCPVGKGNQLVADLEGAELCLGVGLKVSGLSAHCTLLDLPLFTFVEKERGLALDLYDILRCNPTPEVLGRVKQRCTSTDTIHKMAIAVIRHDLRTEMLDDLLVALVEQKARSDSEVPNRLSREAFWTDDIQMLKKLLAWGLLPEPPDVMAIPDTKIWPTPSRRRDWVVAAYTHAAESGDAELLRWLARCDTCPDWPELCLESVKSGHIRVLEWLEASGRLAACLEKISRATAVDDVDSVEMVDWLTDHGFTPPPRAFAVVAAHYGFKCPPSRFDGLRARGVAPEATDFVREARATPEALEAMGIVFARDELGAEGCMLNRVDWVSRGAEKGFEVYTTTDLADGAAWDVLEWALRRCPKRAANAWATVTSGGPYDSPQFAINMIREVNDLHSAEGGSPLDDLGRARPPYGGRKADSDNECGGNLR